jgi:hypothetical protein
MPIKPLELISRIKTTYPIKLCVETSPQLVLGLRPSAVELGKQTGRTEHRQQQGLFRLWVDI